MKIALSELREVTHTAIRHYGYTEDESATVLEVLLYAQLRGNNQGIVKLVGQGMPRHAEAGEIVVEHETPLSTRLNGHQVQGMVVVSRATDLAIQKAKSSGFGMVGTYNTASSTGAIGYYANKIALAGLIGFVFAGSYPLVATHGSHEALFGTNPIAVGLPTMGDPVVLDMATSAIAYFGIVEAKLAGRSIAGDVAYDRDGQPTTNPAAAMEGAIRPFGEHKGAGLSLIVEALTGPLVMGSYVGLAGGRYNWGNLVYAFDPGLLVEAETFKAQMSELVERVKNSRKLPGVDEIMVAGERGNQLLKAMLAAGEVEIEDNLWNALKKVTE